MKSLNMSGEIPMQIPHCQGLLIPCFHHLFQISITSSLPRMPVFFAKVTLQMTYKMPLHVCRHLRTLFYQLLHVVFTKMSWAVLMFCKHSWEREVFTIWSWGITRWCLKHGVDETKKSYWYETQTLGPGNASGFRHKSPNLHISLMMY